MSETEKKKNLVESEDEDSGDFDLDATIEKKNNKEIGEEESKVSSIGFVQNGNRLTLLKNSSFRDTFLIKVGLCFLLHFLFMIGTFYLYEAINSSLTKKTSYNLYISFIVLLSLFLIIKIIAGFFGRKIRNYLLWIFIFDILIVSGLMITNERFMKKIKEDLFLEGNYLHHILVLFTYVGILNFVTFILMAFIFRNKKFNPFIVSLVVIASTVASIPLVPFIISNQKRTPLIFYFIFYGFVIILNVYEVFCIHYISEEDNLLEDDYLIVFYRIHTDWTFKFWKNLFKKKKEVIQKNEEIDVNISKSIDL
jgi:hypothetical protein